MTLQEELELANWLREESRKADEALERRMREENADSTVAKNATVGNEEEL